MTKNYLRRMLRSTFALLALAAGSGRLIADDASQRLAATVTRLSDWLDGSSESDAWRVYLNLNEIETLAGRGFRADIATLEQAAQRLGGQHPSLRHPNFAAVHQALLDLAGRIRAAEAAFPEATYHADALDVWSAAFKNAAGQLRPMSSSEAERMRIGVLTEVQSLRKYVEERGPAGANYVKLPPGLAVLQREPRSQDPTTIYQDQVQQLDRLIQWLSFPIAFPWDADGQAAINNRPNRPAAVLRIGDEVEPQELSGDGLVQQVAWQDDPIPANPTLNEILAGLRQQQLWLQQTAKLDPNPYMGYTNLLLNNYVAALNLGRRENLPALLGRQIDNLANALPQWKPQGDRNRHAEVARIIGLLESVGQSTPLTDAFKRTFWRNNASIFIGESMVNQLASRPVHETQPVYEVILDNQVFGTATTNGQVRIDFVPDDYQAHISLQLSGMVDSDNYTPAGPVTAYTSSQAQIEARRSIYVNAGGLYQRTPYGAANLSSCFKGTSCGRLIDRLAEMQFQNQQAGAEAIGARRAETRLLNQFTQQTNDALNQGRHDLQQRRQEAGYLKSVRPTAYLLTDEHFLKVYAKKATGSQTLAMNPAPTILVPADAVFQCHESLLNNFLEDELSGNVWTHEDVARIEAEIKASAPSNSPVSGEQIPGGQIGDQETRREPFELTLATSRPVEFRFDSQQIQIVLNIRNFKSQGQSINDVQVMIRMMFHLDAEAADTVRLRQLGPVHASLLDPDRIDLNTATVLDLIETTINREIQRQRESGTGEGDGIVLPLNLIDQKLVAEIQDPQVAHLLKNAQLVVADLDEGWASFGWRTGADIPNANVLSALVDAATFAELERTLHAAQEE